MSRAATAGTSETEKTAQTAEPRDLRGMDEAQLAGYMATLGEKRFRAAQLYEWLHGKLAADFADMTNLSKALRERLAAEHAIALPEAVRVQTSKRDDTKKYLFRLCDGSLIESVLMRHDYGYSVCVSSQVGCAMGCAFCASTIGGHKRNLTTGELLGQVYAIQRELWERGEDARVSRVVVMGTGEPLLNFSNLLAFIRILGSERGLHLSKRGITVSTCGIVPQMYALAEEELPITLALSLHAPTQELRERLMPIAKQYPIETVLAACGTYYEKTGRRVTLEYAMIRDVNDFPAQARVLAAIATRVRGHVNLIPLNEVAESAFAPSTSDTLHRFARLLEQAGVNATIRRSMGADIDGACGQLRRSFAKTI